MSLPANIVEALYALLPTLINKEDAAAHAKVNAQ